MATRCFGVPYTQTPEKSEKRQLKKEIRTQEAESRNSVHCPTKDFTSRLILSRNSQTLHRQQWCSYWNVKEHVCTWAESQRMQKKAIFLIFFSAGKGDKTWVREKYQGEWFYFKTRITWFHKGKNKPRFNMREKRRWNFTHTHIHTHTPRPWFFLFPSMHTYIYLWGKHIRQVEKAIAPHSGTLAWKILWTEEPGGLQPMGSLRVRHDWATSLSRREEGNGNPLQCSCLENPRDRGAWWAAVYGVAESDTTEAT